MEIRNVSKEDGLNCAHLINAFRAARFNNLSGEDISKLNAAHAWLASLARNMAEQLKSPNPTVVSDSSQSMKVKAMGPIAKRKKKR